MPDDARRSCRRWSKPDATPWSTWLDGRADAVLHGGIYATIKAAVGTIREASPKRSRDGVKRQCRKPGSTKTARFKRRGLVDPARMDSSIKSFDQSVEPDEIADAVAFFCRPVQFIKGQVPAVEGGEMSVPG